MPIAKCLNCLSNCISEENNGNDHAYVNMYAVCVCSRVWLNLTAVPIQYLMWRGKNANTYGEMVARFALFVILKKDILSRYIKCFQLCNYIFV